MTIENDPDGSFQGNMRAAVTGGASNPIYHHGRPLRRRRHVDQNAALFSQRRQYRCAPRPARETRPTRPSTPATVAARSSLPFRYREPDFPRMFSPPVLLPDGATSTAIADLNHAVVPPDAQHSLVLQQHPPDQQTRRRRRGNSNSDNNLGIDNYRSSVVPPTRTTSLQSVQDNPREPYDYHYFYEYFSHRHRRNHQEGDTEQRYEYEVDHDQHFFAGIIPLVLDFCCLAFQASLAIMLGMLTYLAMYHLIMLPAQVTIRPLHFDYTPVTVHATVAASSGRNPDMNRHKCHSSAQSAAVSETPAAPWIHNPYTTSNLKGDGRCEVALIDGVTDGWHHDSHRASYYSDAKNSAQEAQRLNKDDASLNGFPRAGSSRESRSQATLPRSADTSTAWMPQAVAVVDLWTADPALSSRCAFGRISSSLLDADLHPHAHTPWYDEHHLHQETLDSQRETCLLDHTGGDNRFFQPKQTYSLEITLTIPETDWNIQQVGMFGVRTDLYATTSGSQSSSANNTNSNSSPETHNKHPFSSSSQSSLHEIQGDPFLRWWAQSRRSSRLMHVNAWIRTLQTVLQAPLLIMGWIHREQHLTISLFRHYQEPMHVSTRYVRIVLFPVPLTAGTMQDTVVGRQQASSQLRLIEVTGGELRTAKELHIVQLFLKTWFYTCFVLFTIMLAAWYWFLLISATRILMSREKCKRHPRFSAERFDLYEYCDDDLDEEPPCELDLDTNDGLIGLEGINNQRQGETGSMQSDSSDDFPFAPPISPTATDEDRQNAAVVPNDDNVHRDERRNVSMESADDHSIRNVTVNRDFGNTMWQEEESTDEWEDLPFS